MLRINMTKETDNYMEIAKITIELLSNNTNYIFTLLVLYTFRKDISSLLSRLTNLRIKQGDSEIGVEAVAPVSHQTGNALSLPEELDSEAEEILEHSSNEQTTGNDNWFTEIHAALSNGDIDKAKVIFKEYETNESNSDNLIKNKSLYYYLLFTRGNENEALSELDNLIKSIPTEELKFDAMLWLSICYEDSMQVNEDIKLWEQNINNFTDSHHITSATTRLANALHSDGRNFEAKNILLKRLKNITDANDKSSIYNALSPIEKELGNNKLAVYCKDKALELKPNDHDKLFNTAYQASEEHVDELSISNYTLLLKLDNNNQDALNNLGVRAQNADIKSKAVENYKKSGEFKNTLAMANYGYILLDAGFLAEAREIAEKAIQIGDPHENIYSLLSRINETEDEDNKKWDKLVDESLKRQKLLRRFTYAFYEGKSNDYNGGWRNNKNNKVELTIKDKQLDAKWQETTYGLSSEIIDITVTGEITGSAFRGRYKSVPVNKSTPTTLLGGLNTKNIECIGMFSEDGNTLTVLSEKAVDRLNIELSREDN